MFTLNCKSEMLLWVLALFWGIVWKHMLVGIQFVPCWTKAALEANQRHRLTSPSWTRFDAVSAELLDWILKSKSAIQNTEMKEYKKLQETSGMKKKLKVKYQTNTPGNKIFHQANFVLGLEIWQALETSVK